MSITIGVLDRFDAVRHIAGEINGVARRQLVRHAGHEHFHPPARYMGDLFLRVRVLGQTAAGGQLSPHLIHCRAGRDGAALDPGHDLDPGVVLFAHAEEDGRSCRRMQRNRRGPGGARLPWPPLPSNLTHREVKFFDITRDLQADLAPWPGDASFDYRLVARLAEGSSVNLGRVTTSVHSGTHADAFYHFDDAGLTIERFAPERYLGPAAVVDLSAKFGKSLGEITLADLAAGRSRRAFCSRPEPGPTRANSRPPSPCSRRAWPHWLQEQGVRLLGFDLPSVDAIDSKDLPNHHALAAADIAILEGLDLSAVEAGVYSLSALPLKIIGGDGAPVRAVLWRDE